MNTSVLCRDQIMWLELVEEESANLPAENEEMSPEDIEAAIEAELGGRARR